MKKRPTIPRAEGGTQHTVLLVEDVARSIEFYRDSVRLQEKDGDPDRYMEFDTGEGGVLLIVKREGSIAPMAMDAAAASPSTLTFAIAPDGYDGWKKWFARRGVEIDAETKWIHGGRSLFVRDPDGRRLEFKTPAVTAPPKPKPEPAKEKE